MKKKYIKKFLLLLIFAMIMTNAKEKETKEGKEKEIFTLENIGMGAAGMTIAVGLAKKNFAAIKQGFKTLSKNLKTGIKENCQNIAYKNTDVIQKEQFIRLMKPTAKVSHLPQPLKNNKQAAFKNLPKMPLKNYRIKK